MSFCFFRPHFSLPVPALLPGDGNLPLRITPNAQRLIAVALYLRVVNRDQETATALPFLCCSTATEAWELLLSGFCCRGRQLCCLSVPLLVGLVDGQEGCAHYLYFCSSLTSSVRRTCVHIHTPHLPPCKRKSKVLVFAQTLCQFLKAFLGLRDMYLMVLSVRLKKKYFMNYMNLEFKLSNLGLLPKSQ